MAYLENVNNLDHTPYCEYNEYREEDAVPKKVSR